MCDYLQLIDSGGSLLTQIGQGHFYIAVALLAEVVQTFILADFCYYYVKRYCIEFIITAYDRNCIVVNEYQYATIDMLRD